MSGQSLSSVVLRYDSVDSTSDEARRLLLDDSRSQSPPFVVWSDRQTHGRGRNRHSWWSDEGSLTFTVVLDPSRHSLRLEHEPRLSLISAIAILDALESLGLRIPGLGIRWPNDVEVDDRKLAGLLPEGLDTPGGRRILIGIGLNLATRFDEAPPDVAAMATSLTDLGLDVAATGGPGRILAIVIDRLEALISRLVQDDPILGERWSKIDLLRGRAVRIDLGSRILKGIGRGIGPDGALLVEPDGGGPIQAVMGGRVLRDRPSR